MILFKQYFIHKDGSDSENNARTVPETNTLTHRLLCLAKHSPFELCRMKPQLTSLNFKVFYFDSTYLELAL
jgi:hypothetical protein